MNRSEKTFSSLREPDVGLGNKVLLNMAGLQLSNSQLEKVRNAAVKGAMVEAARLLDGTDMGNMFDSFRDARIP